MAAPYTPDFKVSPTGPALDVLPVVPNDAQDLPIHGVLICKGNGGNVRVTTAKGNVRNETIENGEIMPVIVTRVWATGTSATGLRLYVVD